MKRLFRKSVVTILKTLDDRRANELATIVRYLAVRGGYTFKMCRQLDLDGAPRTFGLRIVATPLEFWLTLAEDVRADKRCVPGASPLVLVRRTDGLLPHLPGVWTVRTYAGFAEVRARELGWPWRTPAQLERLRRAIREAQYSESRR